MTLLVGSASWVWNWGNLILGEAAHVFWRTARTAPSLAAPPSSCESRGLACVFSRRHQPWIIRIVVRRVNSVWSNPSSSFPSASSFYEWWINRAAHSSASVPSISFTLPFKGKRAQAVICLHAFFLLLRPQRMTFNPPPLCHWGGLKSMGVGSRDSISVRSIKRP